MAGAGVFPKINGDVCYAEDINELILHRKLYSDAIGDSTTSTSWEDSTLGFTFEAPINSMIKSVRVSMNVTGSNNKYSEVGLKLVGSNLGTVYGVSSIPYYNYIAGDIAPVVSVSGEWRDSESCLISTDGTVRSSIMLPALKILDASTTLKIRFKVTALGTCALTNVEIEILYVEGFTED